MLKASLIEQLIEKAIEARKMSYSPYSHFEVGACLLGKNGLFYSGCNIENMAYSPTSCAERTAFSKGISEGERTFSAIAIVGAAQGDELEFTYPCGVCRQIMAEFCDPKEFIIIVARSTKDYKLVTLEQLLPYGFSLEKDR